MMKRWFSAFVLVSLSVALNAQYAQAETGPMIKLLQSSTGDEDTMDVEFEFINADESSLHTVVFSWDDGSQNTLIAQSPGTFVLSHQYVASSEYYATLTVTDDNGDVAEGDIRLVTEQTAKEIPRFFIEDLTLPEVSTSPLTVVVENEPDPTETFRYRVSWEFDPMFTHDDPFDDNSDGTAYKEVLTGPSTTVYTTFDVDGPALVPVRVRVCYSVWDCRYGDSLVTVTNQPPIADILHPFPFSFDGVSHPRNVQVDYKVLDSPLDLIEVMIDWGDGTTTTTPPDLVANVFELASVLVSSHTYTASGAYTITITTTDDDGGIDASARAIVVNLEPENVNAGGPYTVVEGGVTALVGSALEPDGEALTYAWDFGADGTVDAVGATLDYTTIDGPAIVPVSLKVCDPYNCVTTTTAIDVANAAPSNIVATPELGEDRSVALTVEFTDPGLQDTHTLQLDWGDGSALSAPEPAQSGVVVSHQYEQPGTYSIIVVLKDDDGGVATKTLQIQLNTPPQVTLEDIEIDQFTGVTIMPTVVDPDDGDTLTYLWTVTNATLDDPTSATPLLTVGAGYSIATLTVDVCDASGACGSDIATVDIIGFNCLGIPATIIGTEGDDVIKGTNSDDVIVGLGGDDRIDAKAGDDIVCGGDGDDRLKGQHGDDVLYGQAGDDVIKGSHGHDTLLGGAGADDLKGQAGCDFANGGSGIDRCRSSESVIGCENH